MMDPTLPERFCAVDVDGVSISEGYRRSRRYSDWLGSRNRCTKRLLNRVPRIVCNTNTPRLLLCAGNDCKSLFPLLLVQMFLQSILHSTFCFRSHCQKPQLGLKAPGYYHFLFYESHCAQTIMYPPNGFTTPPAIPNLSGATFSSLVSVPTSTCSIQIQAFHACLQWLALLGTYVSTASPHRVFASLSSPICHHLPALHVS